MKLKPWLSIWLILLLAVLLRLPLLNGSFWLDEAAQALESARPITQQLDIVPDFQPPLIHFLVHLALYVSDQEWWLRTVAALVPGLISVWVTYRLGKRLGSEKVGLTAALLLATSSFHIFYSQELRPYMLPTMWALLGWYCLTAKAKKNWPLKFAVGFTVCTVAGLYSSYLYPFLLISQVVWSGVIEKSRWRSVLIASVIAAICFVPWLPMFMQQLNAGGEVRRELPGWEAVVSIPQLKSLPLVVGKFLFGVLDIKLSLFFVVTSLAGLAVAVGALLHLRQVKLKLPTRALAMYSCWLLIPLLTAWVVSFWVPVVQPKRVLYLLPAVYLLIGTVAWHCKYRTLTGLVIGWLLLLNLYGTVAYYLEPRYQRENWRALHQDIVNDYSADSVAVFVFPEPFAPWRWYDDGRYPTLSTGTLQINDVSDLTATLKPVTQYRYVVTFDYLQDLSDPQHQLDAELGAFGYQTIEIKNYPNIGFVRIYAQPGATLSLN